MNSKHATSLVACIVLSSILASPLLAESRMRGKVVAVSDGDTFLLSRGGRHYAVQIAGIDAPELGQDHGTTARDHLRSLLRGKRAEIEILEETERSLVGRVSVDGQDVALMMVEAGLAWPAEGAPRALEEAASAAKRTGEGLWSSAEPTPPWSFRAESSSASSG